MINKINENLQFAKDALNRKDVNTALTKMRIIASEVAGFYVDFYQQRDRFNKIKNDSKLSSQNRGDFLICIMTLRKFAQHGNYGKFMRNLLIFLDIALKYGNHGAHKLESAEAIYANFLIQFFEDEIKNKFENDYTANSGNSVLTDVTSQFNSKKIAILSEVTNEYASARLDINYAPIYCNAREAYEWEYFLVETDKSGWASLKAFNNKYLTVRIDLDGQLPPVLATADYAREWEHFRIYKLGNRYFFRARVNNKWASVRVDMENAPLIASCENDPLLWESFSIK